MSIVFVMLVGKLVECVGMDFVDLQELIIIFCQMVFKGDVSDVQFIVLLIVVNQYGFNLWMKEIYVFFDKQNGIVLVVGVDGWFCIINENQQFDGMDFEQDNEFCICWIYCKDCNYLICVIEWMDECCCELFKICEGREIMGLWQLYFKWMLCYKVMIQCVCLVFGFVGIYDKDEVECIVENIVYIVECQLECDIILVNDEIMQEINILLIVLDKIWDDDLLLFCFQIFCCDICVLLELIQVEVVKVFGFLKQKVVEQKVVV